MLRLSASLGHFGLAISTLMAVAGLCGCETIGSIDERAQAVNQITADYAASAVLYNILRAKNAEPLNFVSITGVTGHNTLSASLGLPTLILGPGQTPTQKLFIFGPNVVGGSDSNDFNVNVINDPQSFAALLRPVDPATMGFFIAQGYEQARIFFLFVSRIQIVDPTTKALIDFSHEPLGESPVGYVFDKEYKKFYDQMTEYLDQGLSVKVDPTFVPQGGKTGRAVICFDQKWIDEKTEKYLYDHPDRLRNPCPQQLAAPQKTPPEPPVAVKTGGGNHLQLNISISTQQPQEEAKPDFTFTDQQGRLVQLQTRSVYSAYRFLGELLLVRENLGDEAARQVMPGFFTGNPVTEFLYLTHDVAGCWTSVVYQGIQWCVPAAALGTKRFFSILHQLFELYASPSNQPATSTVRVTPG
jgi:hypothetical protein